MSDSSSLSSPQNPKLRHPHPAPGSLSSVGVLKKTDSNTTGRDQEFSPPNPNNEICGLENPFVVTVRSSPNRLGKSNSSTIVGPPNSGLIQSSSNKTGPRLALYRSNSSLDLLDRDNYLLRGGRNFAHHAHKPENQGTQGCFTRRKDFGSHGSIDVLSSSLTVASGGVAGYKQPQLSLAMASSAPRRDSTDECHQAKKPGEFVSIKETASPRLRLKFQKLFEPKEKGSEVPSPSKGEPSSTSIFRKLRGGKDSTAHPAAEISQELEGKPVLRHQGLLGTEERCRRRVFAHYDCQSVSANISYAAKLRGMLSKRRNTTTGASAASLGNRISSTTTPSTSLNNIGAICASDNISSHGSGEPSEEADIGDGRSNSLVLR